MRDSFKLENNNKKKNNKQNSNLLILIICGLIAVICFGSYFIMNYMNKEVVYVGKKDASKEYVYTIKKEENTFDEGTYYEVPSINLNGEQIDREKALTLPAVSGAVNLISSMICSPSSPIAIA